MHEMKFFPIDSQHEFVMTSFDPLSSGSRPSRSRSRSRAVSGGGGRGGRSRSKSYVHISLNANYFVNLPEYQPFAR